MVGESPATCAGDVGRYTETWGASRGARGQWGVGAIAWGNSVGHYGFPAPRSLSAQLEAPRHLLLTPRYGGHRFAATSGNLDLERELLLTGGTNLAIACVGGLHSSHSPGLVALCKDSAGAHPALVGALQAPASYHPSEGAP